MCGIVGVFPLNKVDLEIDPILRRQLALYLHNEVLFETVARGKDATGMAISYGHNPDGNPAHKTPFWTVLKQPVKPEEYFLNAGQSKYSGQDENANFERFMDVACKITRSMNHILGHTRQKTIGSEFNPLNNHPIIVGNIIGVHNGGVRNHKKIYDKHPNMKRLGEVDSEAIMQLLAEVANDRAVEVADINFVTERIEGPRAVMAYNHNHPEKVIYFHDKERTLEAAYLEEVGLVVLCSERRFLETAMNVYARSRLTVKRDLPALSLEWRNIPDGYGGLIDISAPIEGELKADDVLPIHKCEEVKEEYKQYPSTTTTTTGGSYTHKGSQYSAANQGGGTTAIGKPGPAEIVDLSPEFGSEEDEDTKPLQLGPGQVESHPAANIMDTADEDADGVDDTEEEAEEEEENSSEFLSGINDMFSDDELLKRGMKHLLDGEYVNQKGILERYRGEYKSFVNVNKLDEKDSEEVVNAIYPESFSEGFVYGFRTGAEEEAQSQGDDEDQIQKLEDQVEVYKEALIKHQNNAARASAYIANMKAFLMAAIITNQIGHVETVKGKSTLIFDEDLEDFLKNARGFSKTNPDMVRDLFNDKDLAIISGGMTKFARQLSEEFDEDVRESFGAEAEKVSRSIKG